jgi:hypothetical protein
MNLKTTFSKVKALIESDNKYANNDEHLVAKFWWDEILELGLRGDSLSAKELLHLYKDKRLTAADEITRARRKVNQEFPSTRGLAYKPRMSKVESVKSDIRDLTSNGMTP